MNKKQYHRPYIVTPFAVHPDFGKKYDCPVCGDEFEITDTSSHKRKATCGKPECVKIVVTTLTRKALEMRCQRCGRMMDQCGHENA